MILSNLRFLWDEDAGGESTSSEISDEAFDKAQSEQVGELLDAINSTPQMVDAAAKAAKENEDEEGDEGAGDEGGEVGERETEKEEKSYLEKKKEREAAKAETKKAEEETRVEESEEKEDETEEEEAKPEINEKLLKMLNAQAAGMVLDEDEDELTEEEKEEAKNKKEAEEAKRPNITTFAFVDEENFEEFLGSADGLNKLGSEIASRSEQNALIKMLGAIKVLVPQFTEMVITREKFFENNSDLKIVRNIVAAQTNKIRAKNPNKPFGEVLEQAAKEVREATGLNKVKIASNDTDASKGNGKKKGQKAKFAGTRQGANNNREDKAQKTDEKSDFDSQIDEMLEAVS